MHFKEVKGILSATNGMNISRGCVHGCIYCDARSTCYDMRHDFEDVEIKINAPFLLEDALKRKRKKCMVGTGAMSDPYIPIPENLTNIRSCIVWISPLLPFINDTAENLRGLLQYCVEAKVYGIINFGIGLTLREGDREYFYQKLDEYFPGMKQKYQKGLTIFKFYDNIRYYE